MTATREAAVAAPPTADATAGGARRRTAADWLRTHRAIVILLLVPLAVFGVAQAFGWVFLDGDNFLQNFPMRVLVGRSIEHGELPLWNPYLFSGTPLLGGFNAGAAYPATWLMAILPVFTAWTLNLTLAYDVALAGMYLFLRRQSISTTGAAFGAATFAFAGYMTAQIVHIDLIEGAAWLPWTLVAIHALTERPGPGPQSEEERAGHRRADRMWVALLAVSLGLSLLTGSAEAIIDASVLVAIYAVGRLITMGHLTKANARDLATSLLAIVAGVAGGLVLGAAQWLPGLEFLSQSQRAAPSYAFFTSGQLPGQLVTLLASPFVLGTNGAYAGEYNFEEVTSYVGILALIAACSLLLKRNRGRPEARQWRIWYLIAAVGLLSALGSQTPFDHLLYLIPGIKSERLINRNLLLVDFSLAVLLAWWVHLLFDGRSETGSETAPTLRERWRSGPRAEIVVPCLPLALIGAVCLLLWVWGPGLQHLFHTVFVFSTVARLRVSALVTAMAVIAAAATWIVLVERRLSSRRLRRLLAVVLVVDLVVFNVFVIRPPTTEAKAQAHGPMSASLQAHTGDGRFIIYDPDQFETGQLYAMGQTDLNIFAGLPSAQGYTALTDGAYFDLTGAHFQEDLDPSTLAGDTWDQLNVSTLLSLPGYFVTPLPSPAPGPTVPYADAVRFPGNIAVYNSSPAPVATSHDLTRGVSRTWYFGGALTVDRLAVPLLAGVPGALRVGLVAVTGGVRWLPSTDITPTRSKGQTSLDFDPAAPVRAAGLVVEPVGGGHSTVGTPTAVTAEAGAVALDGRMQFGVVPPHWAFTGLIGSFAVFRNTEARGWAWVSSPGGGPAAAGSSATTRASSENGDQQVAVHATSSVVLDRSESWNPGWRATVQPVSASPLHPATGTARNVTVHKVGVTQGVDLPHAGDYLVSFTYAPRSTAVGLIVSAVGGLGLILWAALELAAGRRRRRRSRAGKERAGGLSPG